MQVGPTLALGNCNRWWATRKQQNVSRISFGRRGHLTDAHLMNKNLEWRTIKFGLEYLDLSKFSCLLATSLDDHNVRHSLSLQKSSHPVIDRSMRPWISSLFDVCHSKIRYTRLEVRWSGKRQSRWRPRGREILFLLVTRVDTGSKTRVACANVHVHAFPDDPPNPLRNLQWSELGREPHWDRPIDLEKQNLWSELPAGEDHRK